MNLSIRATACGLLMSLGAIAQDVPEMETDRPDATESPAVVPRHAFQLEAGYLFEQLTDSTQGQLMPTALFRFGVNENFELRLVTEVASIRSGDNISNTGLQPIEVGIKAKLVAANGAVPRIGFIGHISLSHLASPEFKTRYVAPSFRFSFSHKLTKRISVGYNVGAEWDGESAEPDFIYTLSTAADLTNRLGMYLEVFGLFAQYRDVAHHADGGFTLSVTDNLQLDAVAGVGLAGDAPDYFFGGGVSFRLLGDR